MSMCQYGNCRWLLYSFVQSIGLLDEPIVSIKTDSLDRRYMACELTEAQYRCKMAALDRWAESAFRIAA